MGPGGRLRPAPRVHRSPPRTDSHLGDGHGGVGASSTGLLGTTEDELVLDAAHVERDHPRLVDVEFDDETLPVGVPERVIGPELDAGSFEAAERPSPSPSPQPQHTGAAQPRLDRRPPHADGSPHPGGPAGNGRPAGERQQGDRAERSGPACTAPQLRRFIKSRAYVPMHELRRRFAIEGTDDDVTGVDLESGRIYVGLPPQEGQLLGELLRGGEVGFELSMDPRTPIVVGVYAMRPVPRP
jgi:hypothetical protein